MWHATWSHAGQYLQKKPYIDYLLLFDFLSLSSSLISLPPYDLVVAELPPPATRPLYTPIPLSLACVMAAAGEAW